MFKVIVQPESDCEYSRLPVSLRVVAYCYSKAPPLRRAKYTFRFRIVASYLNWPRSRWGHFRVVTLDPSYYALV